MFVSGLAFLGSRVRRRENNPADEQQESDGNGRQSDLGKHLLHICSFDKRESAKCAWFTGSLHILLEPGNTIALRFLSDPKERRATVLLCLIREPKCPD
jgi:hypothetical protein